MRPLGLAGCFTWWERGKRFPTLAWGRTIVVMDVTEQQHIDAVRSRLYQRYPDLDPTTVDCMIYAAHHRFDGCRIRDFVPLLVERAAVRALDNPPPTTRPEFRNAVTAPAL